MATEIIMPRLGWTMEEGVFGGWLKQDGDEVQAGDLLFMVETDKATQEIEAFAGGILRIPPNGPKVGDVIGVGAVLAYLTQPGESLPQAVAPETAAPEHGGSTPAAEGVAAATQAAHGARARRDGFPAISPRARRVATELGVDWTQLQGSGRTGRIVERDVRAAAQEMAQQAATQAPSRAEKVRVSPVAQRMAEDVGVDLAELAQQAPGRRIARKDVQAALAAREGASEEGAAGASAESVPVSRIRRLIAQRMVESSRDTAAVTLTTEADATELVALREQFKAVLRPRGQAVPSYNDLLIKLTGLALQEHPLLNATWTDEEILLHEQIHIGLAVDAPGGLLVPVVRDVQRRSLRQISSESARLIEAALAQQITPDDLQGGTFTITNLGMYGMDAFTPIINLPQCAILGVGRIIAKPWVVDDQVVPRRMMALSLTFDHRIVDGAPAARFLNTVREYIETPALWLGA